MPKQGSAENARVGGGRSHRKVPGPLLAGRDRGLLAYIRDIRTALGGGRNTPKLLMLRDKAVTVR